MDFVLYSMASNQCCDKESEAFSSLLLYLQNSHDQCCMHVPPGAPPFVAEEVNCRERN